MTIKTSEESLNRAHRTKIIDVSTESKISTSSNEGKHELASTNAVMDFVEGTLDGMTCHKYFVTKGDSGPHFRS